MMWSICQDVLCSISHEIASIYCSDRNKLEDVCVCAQRKRVDEVRELWSIHPPVQKQTFSLRPRCLLRNVYVYVCVFFLWFRVTKNYVLTIDIGTRLI